jgi:hypothetical protein
VKKSLSTLLASVAGIGVLFSSIGITEAHAKPRPYSFGDGTMYTIEFKVGDGADQTARVGTIGRTGRVTAVSDDWGLHGRRRAPMRDGPGPGRFDRSPPMPIGDDSRRLDRIVTAGHNA